MSYIEIVKSEEGITLKLTPEGREELRACRRSGGGWSKGTNDILADLLEDHLCNGWEFIPPEDIGALTASPILSDEVERDDFGKLVKLGKVYWFPDYAVRSEVEELLEKGEVIFPAAEED